MESKKLPVEAYRREIVKAVRDNAVVVITAETGAGKSTQVPRYLLDEGYDLVITQPRRLAARSVAARVAEEMGVKLGGLVGFRTAIEREDSPETRCLFCTDGLALVCELLGQNKGILVLDEVHEWNENMEVLVAWAKSRIEAGDDFKVVLMSATLESEKLAAFFKGAPVISVPGRLFPVEEQNPGRSVEDDAAKLLKAGRNVLVFQPGKQEISATVAALEAMQLGAEILPLHGQLSPEEQKRCFCSYGRPKCVVSTNVAQTSVTIPDIDAVVDSGMERRIELVDGVEGLYLKPISRADAKQRRGRAGRTKEGFYIDHCGASVRPDFPVAEILRKRLDQTVLRLAIAGFDMEALEFFHQPAKSDIHDARRTLVGLGCMTAAGEVTKIGKLVNRLPVSVQYARMLVEADRLKVVDDVLTVAAIMEMGGITVPPPSRNKPDRPDWRRLVPGERESDVMGQLAVWSQAESMTKDEMFHGGVSARDFFRAKEVRKHLADALKRHFRFGSSGRREDILKAVCAGMVDHLYGQSYDGYRNGDDVERQLGSASLVGGAKWLVGKPFDLEIKTRRGSMTLRLIELANKVDPSWLVEVAPHLAEDKTGLRPAYSAEKDVVTSVTETFFNGQLVREETVADGEHSDAAEVFARWLSGRSELPGSLTEIAFGRAIDAVLRANAIRQERARSLNTRTGETAFTVFSSDEVNDRFVNALSGARRIAEVINPEALALPALDENLTASVLRDNPDVIQILGSELAVEYRGSGYAPRVKLSEEMVKANSWTRLPDEGVRLPGGKPIEVVVSFGYYATIGSTDIPQLKAKVREHLNQGLWERWIKPAFETPDPKAEGSVVPFETAVYGQCVVTGDELRAYGTIRFRAGYYSSSWETAWFRSLVEAQNTADESARKFSELQAAAKAERERLERARVEAEARAAALAEAEAARDELKGLSGRDGWNDLAYEFRQAVEGRTGYYNRLPETAELLSGWAVEARALFARVEAELPEAIRRRREAERAQAEAEREEREELAVIFTMIGDDLSLARQAKELAEAAENIKGHKEALFVLREESEAPYGRSRRQDALRWKVPGIEGTEIGERLLASSKASFVDALLAGAVAWLEAEKSVESQPEAEAESGEPVDLAQVDLSKLFGGGARTRR